MRLKRLVTILLRLLLFILGIELLISFVLLLTVHFYGQTDQAQPADAIIVLGAGLRYDGRPGAALIRRSLHAAELWHQGYAPQVICTGGVAVGRVRSEADACREVLVGEGVPAEVIILEERSRSTEENALYTRPIMEANGWQSAILVSDAFHLLRAQWIFTAEGIQVYPSPTVNPAIPTYVFAVFREVVALQWQAITDILQLPVTQIPSI